MVDQRPVVFHSNPNKDFLRGTYDREIIRAWYAERKQKLKYLGLPAWEMLDIIAWEPFLSRFTTIEREENQQHLMFLRANVKEVEHRLHSLYGEFDQIILSGRDRYDHSPDWPYDLVNLDYFGGFVYSNLARPKAIRKLIENQANYKHSFVLIITQDVRDGDSLGVKAAFLEDLRRSLNVLARNSKLRRSVDTVLDWHSAVSTPDSARQALFMNVCLRDFGELEQFDVTCRPAILYSGTGGSLMIHFVTEFRHRPSAGHKTTSKQSLIDVVNFNVHTLTNGSFTEADERPRIELEY